MGSDFSPRRSWNPARPAGAARKVFAKEVPGKALPKGPAAEDPAGKGRRGRLIQKNPSGTAHP
ncbi:hypothetical protein BN940_05176 [Castellaniella defragrans 65Phen]|uniref:Uncharacterized protein n=1 Tax=Castellaniella defragrans (strain DSM 12143 / CCUG 39792 / 65Phen) TaxID=1437824 RepID=W8WVB7_CASD6|nr:hypothetical protein BN940_05176 [Castellaniella defragrans 65Phen]